MFYPQNAPIPEELRTNEFLLRPLRATDAVLDYDAVMSSRSDLLLHSAGKWPREDFTLEENLADLQGHEQEHRDRIAFTYTVMNPAETECLGCVYIMPFERIRERTGASLEDFPSSISQTCVTFWVRQSRVVDGLDARLLQALIDWFRTEWTFEQVVFVARNVQKRQVQLFEEAGMHLVYRLPEALAYSP